MLVCTTHRRADHTATGPSAQIRHDHADSAPGDPPMQHLRLVGVHEDGMHLLLADDEGNRFSVPLDEALRAAVRRDRPRLGQLQIEVAGGLRRTDKGAWTVLLLFNAGGREREAAWQFDPLARTVSAVDDEARWLSEDEDQQVPGPIPAPHLSASNRPSRVYDVEAEGGVGAATMRRREGETVDLMAAMRERSAQRGRRRRPKSTEVPGLDEAPEEALPL